MAKSKELQTVVSFAGKIDPSLSAAAIQSGKIMQKMQKSFQKQYSESSKKLVDMGKAIPKNILKSAGAAVKGVGVGVLAIGTATAAALGGMAKQGLALASDLDEVQNVVSTTFKGSEGAINSFAQTALNKFGVSELKAKQFSGTLGSMFKSMGVGDAQMLTMSTNLSALSGDMASFYNIDPTEAFEKIRSGISGETEPLKQLGINMSVANLDDFAKSKGESKRYADMSQAEQSTLRYGYLMKATADAQGDFLKTSGGFANQQRLLKENFAQMSGRIMQGMLPALAEAAKVVNDFMSKMDITPFQSLATTIGGIIVQAIPLINQLLPTITTILAQVAPLFVGLLQSLMPLASQILPILANLLAMVMPVIIQLVQMLLPIITILLTAFSEALAPLMPIIQQLLVLLTPILTALAKVVGFIIKVAGFLVGKWLEGFIKVFKNLARLFGGGKKKDAEMDTFALGGFASRASIFGEAGLEAAIPIKPGNPRSLALLQRTAQMLGVTSLQAPQIKAVPTSTANTYIFDYNPTITGNASEVEPMLKRGSSQMKQMFEEFIDDRERLSYG